MSNKFILSFLLLFVCINKSVAQNFDNDLNKPLSDSEMHQLHSPGNSAFRYYELADSFSKIDDSINSSNFFLKIDPYYILYEIPNLDSVEKFISRRFRLTKSAKEGFVTIFAKVNSMKKSKEYETFKKMAFEDQEIRSKKDSCLDSACFSINGHKMLHEDSIHFDYLYKYIVKYGWPTIANGSLYASLLAVHDHRHYKAYIPLLKKSLLEGQIELTTLKLINYWFILEKRYDNLSEYILDNRYFKFDISSLIKNEMPETLNEIEQKVREYCPVTTFMVSECFRKDKFEEWGWSESSEREKYLSAFNREIAHYNCDASKYNYQVINDGAWDVWWRKRNHEDLKLFLYVTYDRIDTALKNFNRLIKDRTFITHPVHFEENKSSIQPADSDFLRQLVVWLNQNPFVKLELDGHASDEGNSSANMKLSIARAEKVKEQLESYGVDKDRLTVKGFGATKPVQSRDTSGAQAQNRRVEFIILQ